MGRGDSVSVTDDVAPFLTNKTDSNLPARGGTQALMFIWMQCIWNLVASNRDSFHFDFDLNLRASHFMCIFVVVH